MIIPLVFELLSYDFGVVFLEGANKKSAMNNVSFF